MRLGKNIYFNPAIDAMPKKNPRKRNACKDDDFQVVIPLGLEPRTHTLKVYCSTN